METKCLENKLFRVGNEMTGQKACNTAIEKYVFYSGTFLIIVLTLCDLKTFPASEIIEDGITQEVKIQVQKSRSRS